MKKYGLMILFCFLTGIFFTTQGSYVHEVNNYYPSSIISNVSDYTAFGYGFVLGFKVVEKCILWKWPCGLVHEDRSTYGKNDLLYEKCYDNTTMTSSVFFLGVKCTSFLLCEYWFYKNCSPRSMGSLCVRGFGDLCACYDIYRSFIIAYEYWQRKK